jgi:TetR/AcrR family transcriptional regulator
MTKTAQVTRATRDALLAAAVDAFAELGYGGASTREIARRAGATQQLIGYHFGSKGDLWKEAAAEVFGRARRHVLPALAAHVSPRARAEAVIRAFVTMSAEVPELHRFLTQEARQRGPRLAWMVKRWVKPFYEALATMFAELASLGVVPRAHPAHLYYLLIGSGALFAAAPQAALLAGIDARNPDVVRTHADVVVALLLGPARRRPRPRHPRTGGSA